MRTADGRFTWYGLTLSAGFGDVGSPELVLGLAGDAGVEAPVVTEGDRVVPVVRRSRQGGRLVFVFNLERTPATAKLRPRWHTESARELVEDRDLPVSDDALDLTVEPWSVGVLHCVERQS